MWKKFKNQPLRVGDLLWLEVGRLAYIEGNDPDEPSSIVSIPEGWSFDLNVKYENILSGITSKGKMYDIFGNYVDKILLYAQYPMPAAKRISKLTDEYDYVEITFYKDGGKMNFVEHLNIPILLSSIDLKGLLLDVYGDIVNYNKITIVGEYYNRLI